jgi:hypothetical protein
MPTKRISFSRYCRVLQIMRDDPLLKGHLSKTMIAINTGGQDYEDVPQEAVYVTECISNEGIDPNSVSKPDVVDRAFVLLIKNLRPDPLLPEYAKLKAMEAAVAAQTNSGPKTKSSKIKESEEKFELKSEPPKQQAKPKPDKPKPKSHQPKDKSQPKPEPKAEPKAEKPKPAAKPKKPPAPKDQATTASPAVVEPAKPGDDKGQAATEQPLAQKYLLPYTPSLDGKLPDILPGAPLVTGVAAVTLGYAIINLFEPFVNEAKVRSICDRQLELILEIHRLTVLPHAEEKSSAGTCL